MIPTRIHGVLDYVVGILLIAAPWLLGFANNGPATWVPVILGIGVIAYSMATNYEAGFIPAISMPAHLWMDGLGGAFLAVSPSLFGFADYVWVPHVAVGAVEILTAVMTSPRPGRVPTAPLVDNTPRG